MKLYFMRGYVKGDADPQAQIHQLDRKKEQKVYARCPAHRAGGKQNHVLTVVLIIVNIILLAIMP
jgi:hypothetical protein